MKVLIDTNAYSELCRGNGHIRSVLESADEICVPTIVLGELFAGFFLGTRRRQNGEELDAFLGLPGVTVTAPSKNIAERYGELVRSLRQRGTPIPTNDIWIAATALETAARVLSLDAHFSDIPGIMTVL